MNVTYLNEIRAEKALKQALYDAYYEDLASEIDQYSETSLQEVESSGYTIKDVIDDVAENMTGWRYIPETERVIWSDSHYQDLLDNLLSAHNQLNEVLQ